MLTLNLTSLTFERVLQLPPSEVFRWQDFFSPDKLQLNFVIFFSANMSLTTLEKR